MKKWSRLIFLGLPAFLSLFAGIFADSSTRYLANLLSLSSSQSLGVTILIIGLVCVAIAIILISGLKGAHIDRFETRLKLIIGSLLGGLGTGWAWGGFVLLSKFL